MISQPASSCGPTPAGARVRAGRSTARVRASQKMPAWKRALDVSFVLATAPLWLPLMVLLTIWIKLVSRGPVFFQQERIGFHGERFMILKFRSMKPKADTSGHERHFEQLVASGQPMKKLDAADPRIIPGGCFMRSTGLDELPQLFNVLMGSMSLVGPRPCLPREYECYVGRQRERVKAPPGLTGYWQVKGKNKTTFNQMIDLDLFYAEHMCIGLDLWIILRTFPALFVQFVETKKE